MAKKQKPLPTTSDGFASFMERDLALGGPAWRYGRWDLWQDFISWELAFLQENEGTVTTIETRKPEAVETWKRWREALHAATKAAPYEDHLGVAYMMLGMGTAGFGQFFTPLPVAQLMAAMLANDDVVRPDGRLGQALEPCCGSGVMVLASEGHRRRQGLRPLIWTLLDLDPVCCQTGGGSVLSE